MNWPSSDNIQYLSGLAAIVGLPFASFAVLYAAKQLKLARAAGSGTSLLTLTEAFRENWERFFKASDETTQTFVVAELANLLEAACAIHRDRVLYGHSKKVLEIYLVGIFRLLQDNDQLRQRLLNLLQTKETFENIRHFMSKHKAAINSDAWIALPVPHRI